MLFSVFFLLLYRDPRDLHVLTPSFPTRLASALAAGVPLLGLCRGRQEMNVAFGGSLVRRLHDDVGRFDHRMRRDVPFDWKYRKAHPIALAAGGVLEIGRAHV